jgi:hypothetical protein
MRLLTKGDIIGRAVPYRNLDGDLVVRLKCGPLWFELAPGEAADLARQLLSVADSVNSGVGVVPRTVDDTP